MKYQNVSVPFASKSALLASLLAVATLLLVNTSQANEGEPEEFDPELATGLELEPQIHHSSNLSTTDSTDATPIGLLNNTIEPGTFRTLYWAPGFSMNSLNTPVPVLVAHGEFPGPVVCLTAAVHGDELNGIEIVRRVLHDIDPKGLSGTVIGMPIVNLDGFRNSTRYMSDRRDLNRYFPGNPRGSHASRVAHSLFHDVILHCDYLIDIHTGSFKRANVPQLRGDLKNERILEFSRHFGGLGVLHHPGGSGTLRRSAANAGIPAVTIETGGPLVLENEAVLDGVKGVKSALHNLDMYTSMRLWLIAQPVYYKSNWVRSTQGGILLSVVELNERIYKGQLLGRVVDPITNTSSDIISPYDGKILGKAIDQVVSPGFATFHVGIVSNETQLAKPLPEEVRELTELDSKDSLAPLTIKPSLNTSAMTSDLKSNLPSLAVPKNKKRPSIKPNNLQGDSAPSGIVDQLTPLAIPNSTSILEEPMEENDADDMGS